MSYGQTDYLKACTAHYKNTFDVLSKKTIKKYTEWLTGVNLFPLAYKTQIATTFGLSSYEMVFKQKPRETLRFAANSFKNAQSCCQSN